MSEYQRNKGKIKLAEQLPNETTDDTCKRIYMSLGNRELYYAGALTDTYYDKYVILDDNKLYEIIELKNLDCEYDYFNSKNNEDGTISFDVMFYNGGCGLSEAIQDAVNNKGKY